MVTGKAALPHQQVIQVFGIHAQGSIIYPQDKAALRFVHPCLRDVFLHEHGYQAKILLDIGLQSLQPGISFLRIGPPDSRSMHGINTAVVISVALGDVAFPQFVIFDDYISMVHTGQAECLAQRCAGNGLPLASRN